MALSDDHHHISQWLYREAALLDANEVRRWLEDVVDPEIVYEIPVRLTLERGAEQAFSNEAFYMRETYGTLRTRMTRLETEYAWAEDPPSRTRRFVTNVMIEPGTDEQRWNVASNLLLFRSRYDSVEYVLVSCRRQDVIRRVNGRLALVRRTVLLDHTTLPVHNLGIFL